MSLLPRPLVLLGLLASLMFAHAEALQGMVAMWDNTPMYSFGYIVPFVSLFLLWTEREALARLPVRPAWLVGLPVVAAALLLLVGGHLGGVLIAQQLAFWMSLVGIVLIVFGADVTRQAGVALAYLLLMIPFWDAFTERLHLPFQKLSATIGARMLDMVGVPAYRDDLLLYLPNITLEVARACSGVNYLVAILALGVPMAYLYLPAMGRRLILIGTAIVIAALSNSLRVALIGALSYFDIGSPLHGPFHVLHGLFVSGIGYVVLFIGLRVLAPEGTLASRRPHEVQALGAPPAPPPWWSFRIWHAVSLAALFIVVGLYPMNWAPRPEPLARPLEAIPDHLGPWTAEAGLRPTTTWWTSADAAFHRRYATPDGPVIDVLVWYFESQRQGKELVSHRVDALYREATQTEILADDMSFGVNVVRPAVDGRRRLGLFWYEIDNRVLDGKHETKLFTLWTTATKGRNSGAVVMLLADASSAGDGDDLLHHLRDLAAHMHRALDEALPGRRP